MIVVGFERTITSVDEGDGSFELCVQILTEAELLPTHLDFSFSLDLNSLSGTAGSCHCKLINNNEFNNSNFQIPLIFSNLTPLTIPLSPSLLTPPPTLSVSMSRSSTILL